MNITFIRRSTKSGGNISVWLRYRDSNNTDIAIPTGLSVSVDDFAKLTEQTAKVKDENGKETGKEIKTGYTFNIGKYDNADTIERLQGYSGIVNDIYKNIVKNKAQYGILTKEQLYSIVEKIVPKPEPKQEQIKQDQADNGRTPLTYLNSVIEGMPKAKTKANGKKGTYSPHTILMYKNFYDVLKRFSDCLNKRREIQWSFFEVPANVEIWKDFLYEQDYSSATMHLHCRMMHVFLNNAMLNSKCGNAAPFLSKCSIESEENDKTRRIHLTPEEIQALAKMQIDDEFEAYCRDLLLVGYYSLQRFSDYSRINKNMLTTIGGQRIIKLKQQKTGAMAYIFVDKFCALRDTLGRRNFEMRCPDSKGELKPVEQVYFNTAIKRILKRLAASVPSLKETYTTTLRQREKTAEKAGKVAYQRNGADEVIKPKWQLVSSHTARRSGITNMINAGVDKDIIRMMSGHKTEAMLNHYQVNTEEENVIMAADKLNNINL